jgi:phosphatidylinositol alpha-1,6-mannosyltransferase
VQAAIRNAVPNTKPITLIPPGITVGDTPAAFRNLRRTPTLIHAGRLTDSCGVDSLLRAAKQIFPQHPNLSLFIVGGGPAESDLRRLAESLHIAERTIFTGRLDNLRIPLDAADLFCLPGAGASYGEEVPLALASGLALVAADGSCYDGLLDGKNALLFPDGDDAAMAQQIGRLLTDRNLAQSIAAEGQALARSRFSVARMVAEHVRIYRELALREKTLPLNPGR